MLTAAVGLTVISLKKTLLKWLLVPINHLNLYIRDEVTACCQVARIGIYSHITVLSEALREADLLSGPCIFARETASTPDVFVSVANPDV